MASEGTDMGNQRGMRTHADKMFAMYSEPSSANKLIFKMSAESKFVQILVLLVTCS